MDLLFSLSWRNPFHRRFSLTPCAARSQQQQQPRCRSCVRSLSFTSPPPSAFTHFVRLSCERASAFGVRSCQALFLPSFLLVVTWKSDQFCKRRPSVRPRSSALALVLLPHSLRKELSHYYAGLPPPLLILKLSVRSSAFARPTPASFSSRPSVRVRPRTIPPILRGRLVLRLLVVLGVLRLRRSAERVSQKTDARSLARSAIDADAGATRE